MGERAPFFVLAASLVAVFTVAAIADEVVPAGDLVLGESSWRSGIPSEINYQGYLTGSGGVAVTDTLQMTFSIWDTAIEGSLQWDEVQTVCVINGIFSVLLGAVDPIPTSLFLSSERWLGIEIDGDLLDPRVKITSVGYAFGACRADTAGYALSAAFAAHADSSTFASNADRVDDFHANATPEPGQLFPLDANARMPNEVLYTGSGNGLDADTVDGADLADLLSPINQVVHGVAVFAQWEYEKTTSFSQTINPAKSITSLSRFLLTDQAALPNDGACVTALGANSITIRRSLLDTHGGWVGFQIVEYR